MKKSNIIVLALLTLVIAVGVSLFMRQQVVEETMTQQAISTPPEDPAKQPVIRYAVPEVIAPSEPAPAAAVAPEAPEPDGLDLPATLPSIQSSDPSINKTLSNLYGGKIFNDLLIVDSFIQRMVLTINNLPEKKLPLAHVPFVFPEGPFIISGQEGSQRTNAENHKRYAPYIALLENIDQNQLIKTYVHFYPLLQTAYEQLGYPNAYFNDRLVFVIEHLLATPDIIDPIALEQPSVLYTYADPALEDLSAGQKILLRMGQEQRLRVLSILRTYHFRLTRLTP